MLDVTASYGMPLNLITLFAQNCRIFMSKVLHIFTKLLQILRLKDRTHSDILNVQMSVKTQVYLKNNKNYSDNALQ